MGFNRTTVVDITRPDADTEHSAVMDLDTDLTLSFSNLNTLASIVENKIDKSSIGIDSGVCDLDTDSLVPEERLPTYPVSKLPDDLGYPIGIILMFAAGSLASNMSGVWAECNGAELNREGYASLFEIIGTRFGSSASTVFSLPDFRGIFPRGFNHGNDIDVYVEERTDSGDGTTGDAVGTLQESRNKTHLHYLIGKENVLNNGTDGSSGTAYYSAGWSVGPYVELSGESDFRPINKTIMFVIRIA